jgi:hypothetical protein
MALASSLTSSEQKVFIVVPPNKKPHPCLRHGWGLVKVKKALKLNSVNLSTLTIYIYFFDELRLFVKLSIKETK